MRWQVSTAAKRGWLVAEREGEALDSNRQIVTFRT